MHTCSLVLNLFVAFILQLTLEGVGSLPRGAYAMKTHSHSWGPDSLLKKFLAVLIPFSRRPHLQGAIFLLRGVWLRSPLFILEIFLACGSCGSASILETYPGIQLPSSGCPLSLRTWSLLRAILSRGSDSFLEMFSFEVLVPSSRSLFIHLPQGSISLLEADVDPDPSLKYFRGPLEPAISGRT